MTRYQRGLSLPAAIQGFSLLELLVVVALITLIAGFGTLRLMDYAEKKSVDAVISDVLTISYAAQAYAANHKGEWPDGKGTTPCHDALTEMRHKYYVGGEFVSPWGEGATTGYQTTCPITDTDGQRRDSFQIRFRVPADYAGIVRTRLPSTLVVPIEDDPHWARATHYLPLPRYHAGRVSIETITSMLGVALTPPANCPIDRQQLAVQPLDVCMPSVSASGCTFGSTCTPPPQSLRGFYTHIGSPNSAGQRALTLYASSDGSSYHPIGYCKGAPIRFRVTEFCQ